jgi:hypothetical protein
MLVRIIVLLIAVCSLWEIRRQERQAITRFIETGKEDEKSLRSALHSSKVALWIITVLTAMEFLHSLFVHG